MSLGAQQIHLYDPAGHLKASAAVLQDSLQTLADEGGRTFVLKVIAFNTATQPLPWRPLALFLITTSAIQCTARLEQYQCLMQHTCVCCHICFNTQPADHWGSGSRA